MGLFGILDAVALVKNLNINCGKRLSGYKFTYKRKIMVYCTECIHHDLCQFSSGKRYMCCGSYIAKEDFAKVIRCKVCRNADMCSIRDAMISSDKNGFCSNGIG